MRWCGLPLSAVAAAILLSAVSAGVCVAENDAQEERAALALLRAWAQGGNSQTADLAYVELPVARRAIGWRFVRIAAKRDSVELIGAAGQGATPGACRLDKHRLSESRRAVTAILTASARALVRQSASALENTDSPRRALVFTDGCHEISRTFAEPLSPDLRALFAQLAALADRVSKAGTVAADDPAVGKPIGSATMRPDGLLVFDLVAESPQGDHGLAQLTYSLTDEDYAKMLVHIGGICPGRRGRIVPPWPDCDR
jgi:hypothetical protein